MAERASRERLSSERIDFELSEVRLGAISLVKLGSGAEPRVRATYGAEWHNLIGALENLEGAYQDRIMTPKQEVRYRELKALLRESVPTLKRLGFTLPPVPLDV